MADAVILPLRERKIDVFFAVVFSAFVVTSCISDLLPTVGVDFSHPSGNFFVRSNYWYAHDADPLFMHPPDWMRIVTGLSAFVYMPFYIVLVGCFWCGCASRCRSLGGSEPRQVGDSLDMDRAASHRNGLSQD